MDLKMLVVFCLLVLSTFVLNANAQRDGRRRSGRRKPTTESPREPVEEPESEASPQNLDIEPEPLAKPTNSQSAEAEKSIDSPSTEKEPTNHTSGGPPFIVPRGTRKPRPMQVRNNSESRPRPTLPTFSRKSNRRPKPERHDFKKLDENSSSSSSVSTSTTTAKPSRNSSRRRSGNSSQADRNSNSNRDPQANAPAESSSEAAPKKRFGGATRKPSRGSRRNTTVPSEA